MGKTENWETMSSNFLEEYTVSDCSEECGSSASSDNMQRKSEVILSQVQIGSKDITAPLKRDTCNISDNNVVRSQQSLMNIQLKCSSIDSSSRSSGVVIAETHCKDKNVKSKKAFFCDVCGKHYSCASYVKSHNKIHEGMKPYVCDLCGKCFVNSANLKIHHRVHTGERPFACVSCDKRFLQLSALKEHVKIHAGLKEFICERCGKMFMTQAQLRSHTRIHVGIKSFACGTCGKSFFSNGDLLKHDRIHKDSRPFVCGICNVGFKYSSNLCGHVRIHTGQRPFVCNKCGKSFTYSSHLSRHSKLHDKDGWSESAKVGSTLFIQRERQTTARVSCEIPDSPTKSLSTLPSVTSVLQTFTNAIAK